MTFFSLIEIGKIARNTLKHNSDYINHISLCLFFYLQHTHTHTRTIIRIHTRISYILPFFLPFYSLWFLFFLPLAPCPYLSLFLIRSLFFWHIQHTVTVIHIYRAEWPYAISIVRLVEACTNVNCATKGVGQ